MRQRRQAASSGRDRFRRLRAVPALIVAMVLVVLVGCGSTVQVGQEGGTAGAVAQDGGQPAAAGDDHGLALDAEAGPAAEQGTAASSQFANDGSFDASGPAGETAAGESSNGSTAAGPSTSGSSTTASSGSASAQRQGAYGPGVTDDEIVIGIAFPDEQSKENNENFLGASGITVGNLERYYDIMAESINANGGIAGRAMRYSKYQYSTASGANFSQLEQEACAQWTQDDPALVATALTAGETILGCAKDAGMGTWDAAFTSSDDRTYATYPTHVELSAIGLTRQGRILAGSLDSQGYFDTEQDALDTGYKLGVVTFDAPHWKRAVNDSLEPSLNQKGHQIDDKAWVKEVRSVNDLGEITAQVQSTVLRFKSNGITHVTIVDQQGVLTLLFLRSAENQDYRPRYGLTSQAGHTVIAKQVPEQQLHGALGVGWLPQFDVPASERPESPGAAECMAMYKEHGEEPADDNNRAVMLSVCETIGFVKVALEAGLPDLTAQSYARGAESLGEFVSFNSFANYLAPGRHDGAAYYRTVAYDAESGCVCFHYTSDLIADLP